jgi:YD repeat-containing protein
MNFNSSGQIASWTNHAGATVTFTYSGGYLATVANAVTGRQLTLTYNGSTIASVTDGARTVSYTYTNNVLTTFTDALQQNTTYSYDTSGEYDTAGHLTQVFYPSNPTNAFVSTYYDATGKVYQQANGVGDLTQTYFGGLRSEVDDPAGNRQVWYFDSLGDTITAVLDYGPSPHLNVTTLSTYDQQRNLLFQTLPEGNAFVYTYDTVFNPLTVTENPKPGSNTPARAKAYTYVTPAAALPNFETVQTSTDWDGYLTTFSYDANGNLVSIVQPTVSKPGVGNAAPTQSFTYTAIGLPLTRQDAEGRVTRYQYDPTHADESTTMTLDSGPSQSDHAV